MVLALKYVSDDGNSYQLGTQNDMLQNAVGDLLPAVALDPIYPFYWYPRGFVLQTTVTGGGGTVIEKFAIACSPTDSTYLAGPGQTVTIAGTDYLVVQVLGEIRVTG